MISIKTVLSAAAVAGLMATAAVTLTAAPASARVICNNFGDCWHADATPRRVPGVKFTSHNDDWYFHQTWENNNDRHYRDYHKDRGYYRNGIWLSF